MIVDPSNTGGSQPGLSERLSALCETSRISTSTFIDTMTKDFRCRRNHVQGWVTGTKEAHEPSLKKMIAFWNGYLHGFEYTMWLGSVPHFRKRLRELAAAQDTLGVGLPCEPTPMDPDKIDGLAGDYHAYRMAYTNTGAISRESLCIRAAADGSRVHLDVTFNAVATGKGAPEEFTGQMFKLGKAYYVVASYRHKDNGRIRFLTLPEGANPDLAMRWGILSGVAGANKLPVATRVLLIKCRSGIPPMPVRRLRPNEVATELGKHARFLSNDISTPLPTFETRDHILTVSGEIPILPDDD